MTDKEINKEGVSIYLKRSSLSYTMKNKMKKTIGWLLNVLHFAHHHLFFFLLVTNLLYVAA